MSLYSVITLGSMKTTSDVENKTIVCGSFLTTQSTFANQLGNSQFNPLTYTLEVNGSTTRGNNINIIGGSVALGPNPLNRVVQDNKIQYTVDGQIKFNVQQGNNGATVKVDTTLPARCAEIGSSIISLSKMLAQLPSNNNATIPTSQPGPLNFVVKNVDINGVAVFNLPASSVFGNNKVQQIEIVKNNNSLQLVVINLYGTSISWSGSNLVGTWFNSLDGRARTIWNFPDATTINFDSNLKGALLAPYAAVVTRINIDGAVAVESLDTSGEVHNPLVIFPTCAPTTQVTTGEQPMNHFEQISSFACM